MKMNIPNLDLKLNLLFLNELPARARRIWWRGLPPVGPTCRSAWTRGSASLPGSTAHGVIKILSVLAVSFFGFLLPVQGQDPKITLPNYPMDTSVSVGATVSFRVYASSTNLPMTIQWQHEGTNLPAANSSQLNITNVTVAHAGGYVAWVTNASNNFTNTRTAILTVDPTFTQVMAGDLTTDTVGTWNVSWIDIDGDGYLDLSVAPSGDRTVATPLYHNEGDGTFRRITTNAIGQTAVRAYSHVWGDYDNDGQPDLFVPNVSGMNDMLFRNLGNGAFTRITTGHPVIDGVTTICAAWADYDRDGFLDLFVAAAWGCPGPDDLLYRNNGDGTFRKMTSAEVGLIVGESLSGDTVMWADVDNDGWPELSRTVKDECSATSSWTNQLLHLDSEGKFYLMDIGEMKRGTEGMTSAVWGDFDNDGLLDAVVGAKRGLLGLYRNLSGQGFTNIAANAFSTPITNAQPLYAGDYDNDGWLDLFVFSMTAPSSTAPSLYRNNGNGSFTLDDVGSPTSVVGGSGAWNVLGDYNNDGFLDIFVGFGPYTRNLLFRHNGNANHWLKVKLDGRASNRSGIGAKVRVNATVGGTNFWQMREISGQGLGLDNGLIAHFGLGDATKVDTLRIEWPSGIVQEIENVATNQFLTVVESQGYTNAAPSFTGATKDASGAQLSFTEPATGARYILEASSDLINWTKLMARTSTGVTTNYTDTAATNYPSRYYRLQVP